MPLRSKLAATILLPMTMIDRLARA